MVNRGTLTRLAALGTLSRSAGEGLQRARRKALLRTTYPAQSPSPALRERGAAARDWPARQAALGELLAEAEREDRQVVLLTTAPTAVDEPAAALRPVRAADARAAVQALLPKPWPVDRRAALARLEALSLPDASSAIWLSDGVADDGGNEALADFLVKRGSLRYLTAQPADAPLMLAAGDAEANDIGVVL